MPSLTYKGLIGFLPANGVFVYGANAEGRHGKGSALLALQRFGAKYGTVGFSGRSYGIVTKNLKAGFVDAQGRVFERAGERSVSPELIKQEIVNLYDFALLHEGLLFYVAYTAEGSNLNGYSAQEMAGFFAQNPPENIVFEEEFAKLVESAREKCPWEPIHPELSPVTANDLFPEKSPCTCGKHLDKDAPRFYAGIGSRGTPEDPFKDLFAKIAKGLAAKNFVLRSGGADGADSFFEAGCKEVGGQMEIYLPWRGFNKNTSKLFTQRPEDFALAAVHHPGWPNLKEPVRKLMARNVRQVGNKECGDTLVSFVLCWTPEGKGSGGTGQALRIAKSLNIRIFDFGKNETLEEFRKYYKTL